MNYTQVEVVTEACKEFRKFLMKNCDVDIFFVVTERKRR